MSMLNPRPGDVFILRDYEYSKKEENIPDDVKTIRYDRPVIILTTQKDILTVIPMTTHYERHFAVYKLQIQHDVISGALLSQATTVEVRRLDNYLGKLRPRVFNNLKHEYFNYIEKGFSKRRPLRTIPRLYNELDIIRYFGFHIYMDKKSKELYMCVKSLKDHFYFIPVRKSSTCKFEIATVCGYLDFDNMWMLTEEDYREDFIDIGNEYRSNVRNIINKEVYIKKGFNIYTKLYIDTFSDVSWAVHELFGQANFILAMTAIKDIIINANLQQIFVRNCKALLPETKNEYKSSDVRMQVIKEHIMRFVDPLNCDLDMLRAIKNQQREIFENLISPFKEAVYVRADTSRLFDGEILFNPYKIENMKFIAEYFRSTLSS